MRALVVYAHPDPESYSGAVLARAVRGLDRAGHEVRVTDLYADGFDGAMTPDERVAHKEPGVGPDLQRHADDLRWAELLVLVYPTWWSGFPAILKGWVDRVWVAGVAWELPDGANRIRPRLGNIRRIIAITGHGSSKLVNMAEGESGKRTVTRSMRAMCSWRTRTTWCALYGLDASTAEQRDAFLERVERTTAGTR
jgi:NAD(P)H dehydrogenase (quinone)